jgi:hypothetical protein
MSFLALKNISFSFPQSNCNLSLFPNLFLMLRGFLTGLSDDCNFSFIRLVLQLVPIYNMYMCARAHACEMATNMISLACHHCQREGYFIGNPLFQLVKQLGAGHLSLRQTGSCQLNSTNISKWNTRQLLLVCLPSHETWQSEAEHLISVSRDEFVEKNELNSTWITIIIIIIIAQSV